MKEIKFKIINVVVLTILFSCWPNIAQGEITASSISLSDNDVLPPSDNFCTFDVNTTFAGDYYINFWLQPARYADGSYTPYCVFVNNVFKGNITPNSGDWQSISIDGNPKITFNSGFNSVMITTPLPETPNVESIRLATTPFGAEILSDAYISYTDRAKSYNEEVLNFDIENTTNTLTLDANIPLKYSFYKYFSFSAGQEITITSSSTIAHSIDLFYIGTIYKPSGDLINSISTINTHSATPNGLITGFRYTATQLEKQGINWKANAEPALNNSNYYIATLRAKLPQSGRYMIKLRSAANNTLGIADVNINGNYFYDDVPIYYAYTPYIAEANDLMYYAYTSSDLENDNPMLFIEGADADRIVDFNDNAESAFLIDKNIGQQEALVWTKYFIKPSNVHVSNSESLNPESYCHIQFGQKDRSSLNSDTTIIAPHQTPKMNNTNVTIADQFDYASEIKIHFENKQIYINSTNDINLLEIYSLNGFIVRSISDPHKIISVLDLPKGIYIVKVFDQNGCTSKKITIK